jgi:TMEM175 potassium channel family protein
MQYVISETPVSNRRESFASGQASQGKSLMGKNRLEAFSDGVIAIIITIMVLEMKVPHGDDLSALRPLIPVFISYVLSFVYVGIYWNNHHHLLHAVQKINGPILWANLHLLFWLSLLPFVTGWMGENHFSTWPVAVYGTVLLMAAIAYSILELALIRYQGTNSQLAKAVGQDFKGKISLVIYAAAIPLSFASRWIAFSLYVAVAVMWVIPDPRIERKLNDREF